MRLEYQDSIDRYLLNRMPDDERSAFEANCACSPELKEQLEHTRVVKTVISERSRMLEKIQSWDEKYAKEKKTAARKKHTVLYWMPGIAAAFLIGYFLFPTANKTKMESSGNLVAVNQDSTDVPSREQAMDNTVMPEVKSEKRLAYNDAVKEHPNQSTQPIEEEKIYSFGSGEMKAIEKHNTNEDYEELYKIEQHNHVITSKIEELRKQRDAEMIDEDVYNSMAYSLKCLQAELNWKKVQVLLKLKRKKEALEILSKMKSIEGEYKNKADSLYKETIYNE